MNGAGRGLRITYCPQNAGYLTWPVGNYQPHTATPAQSAGLA